MSKTVAYAILFIVVGLLLSALAVPLISPGNAREKGQIAFPFIVLIGGGLGYFVGRKADARARVQRRTKPEERSQPIDTEEPKVREENPREYDY